MIESSFFNYSPKVYALLITPQLIEAHQYNRKIAANLKLSFEGTLDHPHYYLYG